jgi:hypothetical protein
MLIQDPDVSCTELKVVHFLENTEGICAGQRSTMTAVKHGASILLHHKDPDSR